MKVNFVGRDKVKVRRKSSSKFAPLIEALEKLEPGGDAVEVSYSEDKELNSMRNIVYTFNRERGEKVKSGKDERNKKVYFYKN